jgi:hypothetical protein
MVRFLKYTAALVTLTYVSFAFYGIWAVWDALYSADQD